MDDATLKAIYGSMTEKNLQAAIIRAAFLAGWKVYHTFDSRRSDPGFPDLVLVKRRRLLVRELKTEKGKVTADQLAWIDALKLAGLDVGVWRPHDWGRGDIQAELTRE